MSAPGICDHCGDAIHDTRRPNARFCDRSCQLAARKNIGLRLPPDVHSSLQEAAEERGLSINWLVTRAVREFLDRLIPADEFKMTRDP